MTRAGLQFRRWQLEVITGKGLKGVTGKICGLARVSARAVAEVLIGKRRKGVTGKIRWWEQGVSPLEIRDCAVIERRCHRCHR